jgi:hypothetical protein
MIRDLLTRHARPLTAALVAVAALMTLANAFPR